METEFLMASLLRFVINLAYALVALVLGIISFEAFDKHLFKKIDFVQEVQAGNIAAAIMAASILGFIAIVIGLALR